MPDVKRDILLAIKSSFEGKGADEAFEKLRQLEAEINRLNGSLKSVGAGDAFRNIGDGARAALPPVMELTGRLKDLGENVRAFGTGGGTQKPGIMGQISQDIGKVVEWTVATSAVFGTIAAIKSGVGTISEFEVSTLNLALAGKNLGKTWDGQRASAIELTSELLVLKETYGSVGKGAVDAAATFARLGMGQAQIADTMKTTLALSNIAGMEVTSTAGLLEAMVLQFKLPQSALSDITDGLAKIRKESQATVEGLMAGGSRLGAVWREAGGSVQELFATIGAVKSATFRPEGEIANGLKTITQRLAMPNVQEKVHEIAGLDIVDLKGNMMPVMEIFDHLAAIYPKLTQEQREQVTLAMAGTRQANILQALVDNNAKAHHLVSEQMGAQGELLRQNGILIDTLDGKVRQLHAAWENLWASPAGSQMLRNFISNFKLGLDQINSLLNRGQYDYSGVGSHIGQRVAYAEKNKIAEKVMSEEGLSAPFWSDAKSTLEGGPAVDPDTNKRMLAKYKYRYEKLQEDYKAAHNHGDILTTDSQGRDSGSKIEATAGMASAIDNLRRTMNEFDKEREGRADLNEMLGLDHADVLRRNLADIREELAKINAEEAKLAGPVRQKAFGDLIDEAGQKKPAEFSERRHKLEERAAHLQPELTREENREAERRFERELKMEESLVMAKVRLNSSGKGSELDAMQVELEALKKRRAALSESGPVNPREQGILNRKIRYMEEEAIPEIKNKLDVEDLNDSRKKREEQERQNFRNQEKIVRAEARLQASLLGGPKKDEGVVAAELKKTEDQAALDLAKRTGDTTRQEVLERDILNDIADIEVARNDAQRKGNEEHRKKLEQMQRELGMLSDQDMLKARILAGEMKRGEISKTPTASEFMNMPQESRRMFAMVGGQVPENLLGLNPPAAGAANGPFIGGLKAIPEPPPVMGGAAFAAAGEWPGASATHSNWDTSRPGKWGEDLLNPPAPQPPAPQVAQIPTGLWGNVAAGTGTGNNNSNLGANVEHILLGVLDIGHKLGLPAPQLDTSLPMVKSRPRS